MIAIVVAIAGSAQLSAGDVHEVSWRSLIFKAKKWMIKATAEVRLEEASASELQQEQLTELARASSVVRVDILSHFFGRHSKNQLWIDRHDGRALERLVVERGRHQRVKRYRFERDGIHARGTTPANAEEAKIDDPAAWTAESQEFYESGAPASGLLTEPAAILYLVSALEPSAFDKGLEIWTFTKQHPIHTRIHTVGTEQVRVSYGIVGQEHPGVREVEAVVYAISSTAAPDEENDFTLLGLEGDIEIAVERSLRIPVEVRGRIPHFGKVVVRLHSAELVD